MLRTLFSSLLLISWISVIGQVNRQFSPSEIQQDFQVLKESFDTYNPALGVFQPKESYEQTYDSLYAQLDEPLTALQFYKYIVRLAKETNEGHTLVGSPTDTVTNIYKGFFDGSFKYFPLSLNYLNGSTYIWANFSADSTLLRGDKILKINDEDINSIFGRLRNFAITDGDILAAANQKVVDNFGSYYFWFIDQPQKFKITYQSRNDDDIKELVIPALDRGKMIEYRDIRYGKSETKEKSISDIYEFKIEGNKATLRLKTFNRQLKDQFEVKTKKLYKQIFTELRNKEVEHLIIDVRNNTGGRREYAWDILPYLMKEDHRGIIYSDVSWKGKSSGNKFPKRNPNYFKGKVYVLANSNSFSNGSVVANYAQRYADAIVIGSETASRFEGFAAGSRQYVTLPNTKILIRIPRYLYLMNQENSKPTIKNRGVIPDYKIEYTLDDLENNRDLEMLKAMDLINSDES